MIHVDIFVIFVQKRNNAYYNGSTIVPCLAHITQCWFIALLKQAKWKTSDSMFFVLFIVATQHFLLFLPDG